MNLKTLRDFNFKGKVVLLRSDLNSDIVRGKVLKGERILESLKSIDFLKKRGAKVVILAHQGNPEKKDFLGLRQHAKLMGLRFVNDVVGKQAIDAIWKMKSGDVILLDNVRLIADEFSPRKRGNIILKHLLPVVDIYINDAFSVSHRNHTSIVGFADKIESGIGLLFEKEIRAIENIKMKNCLFILGGAKPESNIKLLGRGNIVLAGGLFGQICLAAKGFDFGYQNDFLKKTALVYGGYNKFLRVLKKKLTRVETPIDFAVNLKGKRQEFGLEDFPMDLRIEDIGIKTITRYSEIIKNASGIYMKGPVGWAEDARFEKGTIEILKTVANCRGFSLLGGGQLSEVIIKSGINKKKFGHVSLSGGALLSVIAGEKLVGLRALGYYAL